MLISPSPATLERHTDALLLAATTDDAHDDAQLMCRAALEALNVLDLRLVGAPRCRVRRKLSLLGGPRPCRAPLDDRWAAAGLLGQEGCGGRGDQDGSGACGGAGQRRRHVWRDIRLLVWGPGRPGQAGTEAAASRVKHIVVFQISPRIITTHELMT